MNSATAREDGAALVGFDWRRPDFTQAYRARVERLKRIRAQPDVLPALIAHYRDNPAAFISDWSSTYDPRGPERGVPAQLPFVLFPRQTEFVAWMLERWKRGEPGIAEKSRDVGMSWLAMAFAGTMCLFRPGLTIGVGSRKAELVDRSDDPSCLMFKARFFLQHLPREFVGAWSLDRNSAHMRISFPNGSAIVGESGDELGRGGRTSMFIVDEAAFLERPQRVDAALSATTNCRIDISTPNGRGNSFAERRFGGRIPVFTFHWRDDPRKDSDWYERQCATLDPVTVAREIDLNYSGSLANQLIPAAWVQSAIGAHLRLGIEPSGTRVGALDVADQGRDLNAFAGRYGIVLEHLHSWAGRGSDIYASVVKAFALCDDGRYPSLIYDGDGLGSGVRGDARRINEDRQREERPAIRVEPFRGSAAPCDPDREMVPGRKNLDFFANAKAQAWWHLRLKFQATHRAIAEGQPYIADELVSISPDLAELPQLIVELSQPTFTLNSSGKLLIDKTPEGSRSPNLADAVMIAFNPSRRTLEIWRKLGLAAAANAPR